MSLQQERARNHFFFVSFQNNAKCKIYVRTMYVRMLPCERWRVAENLVEHIVRLIP